MCGYIAAMGLVQTWANLEPEGDQNSYLELAMNVAEGRGFRTRFLHPFAVDRGFDCPEAVRHPLYPYLLACFAPATKAGWLTFFPTAKAVTLAIVSFAPLATYLGALAFVGAAPALLAALMVTLNLPLHYYSTAVFCEGLLLVLLAPAVLLLAAGFRRPRLWPVAGVLWGVAYLTKGTAMLVAPAFVLGLLVQRRGLRSKWLWMAAAAALAVCAPWLVRNMREFGTPLASFNDNVFWLDQWSHIYRPYDPAHLPSMQAYFATHSIRDALQRLGKGIAWQATHFGVAASPTVALPFMQGFARRQVVAMCAVMLALLRLAAWRRRRGARVFLAALVAAFVFAFAWYDPIVGTTQRFYFPIVPVIYVLCADLLVAAWRRTLGRHGAEWGVCGLAVAALMWVSAASASDFGVAWGRRSRNASVVSPAALELRAWIDGNVGPNQPLAYGPERPLYLWATGRPHTFVPVDETKMTLSEFLDRFKVAYLILDEASMARRPYLWPHFFHTGQGFSRPDAAFYERYPNLKLVFVGRAPQPVLVFKVAGHGPMPQTTAARRED